MIYKWINIELNASIFTDAEKEKAKQVSRWTICHEQQKAHWDAYHGNQQGFW